ncbi:serine/threonine protein kinase [Candidatus Uhrbacteria bacterium]|nr:serine/threonine protein kinase [Candidatus Uhrbacteria bacterium]
MATIAGYEIGKLLGKGAFGETFRATKGGKVFALKLIKEEAIQAGYDVDRFKREVRSLQKVQSPNIVRLIEAGRDKLGDEIRFYIVLEFLEGKDFAKRFQDASRDIPEATLKQNLIQVVEALKAIHSRNIVHRDLKPQNVFVTDEGQIKVLDFGLVKMLDYTTLTTLPGQPIGTPMYIAPEILRGEEIDYRADFYSFGVMVYYLVTKGAFPFDAQDPLELYGKVANEPPIAPTRRNGSVSSELENLILTLLMKQPYQRKLNHDELKQALLGTPFSIAPAPGPLRRTKRLPHPKRCFFRLLQNEGVQNVRTFLNAGGQMDGFEFPANFLPRYQKSFNEYQQMGLSCMFDPVTYRLPYSSFAQTEGVVKLPYVPDPDNVLDARSLRSLQALRKYARDTIDWQLKWGCSILVAPFHFARELSSPWIDIDIKLMEEAAAYGKEKAGRTPVYGGLALNIEAYTVENNRLTLLNRYSRARMDGFLFFVDNIDERTTNPLQLKSYAALLACFQELGQPVFACRVGTLGIALLCLGIDGMTTGIASLSSFSESVLLANRSPGPYDMPKRFYIPQLLLTLPLPLASEILSDDANSNLRPSNSFISGWGRTDLERASKPHYLWVRTREVAKINDIKSGTERVSWFLDRVEKAIKECERIRRAMKVDLRPEMYQHLKTWQNIFRSISATETK